MKVYYDDEGDILYIQFKECKVICKELDEDTIAELDREGNLVGIEILFAKERGLNKEGVSIDLSQGKNPILTT